MSTAEYLQWVALITFVEPKEQEERNQQMQNQNQGMG